MRLEKEKMIENVVQIGYEYLFIIICKKLKRTLDWRKNYGNRN